MNLSSRLTATLLAFAAFIVILFAYFQPVLDGKVVAQQDIIRARATSQEIYKHREKHGEEPLWTNSQFSGMPTFQMSTKYPANLIKDVKNTLTKPYFPASLGLIFTLFLGFFILLMVMRTGPWISLIGAFAFAFSTYFIISFEAGHTGKLRVIGFIAPCIASIVIALRGKWLLGGALTAFTVAAALGSNHLQIAYYLALLIVILMITEGAWAVKAGKLKPYMMSAGVLLIAGILAVGPNLSSIWSTYVYSQETIRGGSSPLEKDETKRSSGLNKDYAMRWSYGKAETFNLLIPNFHGGASQQELSTSSHTAEVFRKKGAPERRIEQIMKSMPTYWGDQPFTSGPTYLGAVICFLFFAGLFLVRQPVRWWTLAIAVFAILLAWGKHFPVLNNFMFDHFPFYNKFRAPSMILTLVCFAAPLLGMLGLHEVIRQQHYPKQVLKKVQYALYITGGLCLLFAVAGDAFFSFQGPSDQRYASQGFPMDALREDRAAMLKSSAFRSLVFILLAFLLIWGFLKKKLSKTLLLAGVGLLVLIDLWVVDKRYLNESHFTENNEFATYYETTQADRTILNYKKESGDPHFRVLNLAVQNPFTDALTSYHHRSVGGYHAAKLIRYQDLIERQLSQKNRNVLNMLNTKWFIVPAKKKKGQQERAQWNNQALGNAWFVQGLKWVPDAEAAMKSLNDLDPSKTTIVNEEFKPYMSDRSFSFDEGSSINLTQYRANRLTYKTDIKDGPHFTVFSEVYYEGSGEDWKVFIDGEPASHIRVNYTLRGMVLPKGRHTVEFKFHPKSYYTGEKISLASSILILALIAGGAFYEYRKGDRSREKEKEVAVED